MEFNKFINIKYLSSEIIKILNYLTPLVIILSSLKLNGYVISFVILFPFLFLRRNLFLFDFKNYLTTEKTVYLFFIYLIIQSIRGYLFLGDIRILFYWTIYFAVCLFLYLKNSFSFKKDTFYRKKYIDIFYYSINIYFLGYFLMNIISQFLYSNTYQIQNLFWAGSSTAFHILTLYFICLNHKWRISGYKIFSQYSISFAFINFLVMINSSRLGLLSFFIFISYVIVKNLSLKQFINALAFVTFSTSILFSNSILPTFFNFQGISGKPIEIPINSKSVLDESNYVIRNLYETKNIFKKDKMLRGDHGRMIEFLAAKEKFVDLNLLEKIFGTGMHTSRYTLVETRNSFVEKYRGRFLCEECFEKVSIVRSQHIISLLFDTGIFGLFFLITLYSMTLKIILKSKNISIDKTFYVAMLFLNFLCLLIGQPLNNLSFMLSFLPNAYLSNLIKK